MPDLTLLTEMVKDLRDLKVRIERLEHQLGLDALPRCRSCNEPHYSKQCPKCLTLEGIV